MGIFDGMMGNASEADAQEVEKELGELLSPGENVEHAYKLIRDLMVFTDKRLMLVDNVCSLENCLCNVHFSQKTCHNILHKRTDNHCDRGIMVIMIVGSYHFYY